MRGQRHVPAALYPRKRAGTHFTGGWVGPRAGLDKCGKSRPQRDLIRRPVARSQSLYRLRYPAHERLRTASQICLHFSPADLQHSRNVTIIVCCLVSRHLLHNFAQTRTNIVCRPIAHYQTTFTSLIARLFPTLPLFYSNLL